MTEVNCTNYLNKIMELKDICQDETTTKINLELVMNDLQDIKNDIEADILVIGVPVTMSHFHKFFLVLNLIERGSDIQSSLLTLLKTRTNNIDNYASLHTYEEIIEYTNETKLLKEYIDNLMFNCNCMKDRINIMQHKF